MRLHVQHREGKEGGWIEDGELLHTLFPNKLPAPSKAAKRVNAGMQLHDSDHLPIAPQPLVL